MVSKSGDRFLVVTTDLEGNSFADYALEAIVETETPCFGHELFVLEII